MCDYSLHSVASRPATAGDRLVTTRFVATTTRGSENRPSRYAFFPEPRSRSSGKWTGSLPLEFSDEGTRTTEK
jgi:hypothetical protein